VTRLDFQSLVFLFSLCGFLAGIAHAMGSQPPMRTVVKTEVAFKTTDNKLQKLYDTAVAKAKANPVPNRALRGRAPDHTEGEPIEERIPHG